jgi:hypothetical protein
MKVDNKLTQTVAAGVLGVYLLYGLFAIPFPYLLLSVAVGLITYSVNESMLYTTIAVVLTGVIAVLISQANHEKFTDNPVEVVREMTDRRQPKQGPTGVYASDYVEGFEDVSGNVPTEKKEDTPPVAATSKPASAAGFKDKNEPDGLFKLGSIPTDKKGGFHIDQGTTVINALNALQPDQVKKMSEDTQKLIDTQKSLMMMLGTMKPMLTDGKQLIDTFQQMFGPNAAAQLTGAPTPPGAK